MKRALQFAVGVGLLPGSAVYALVPSLPAALGTAAVYVGAAYFYLAFDVSLLAPAPRFDERSDRLGYGVGLFGLSVTPILFAHGAGSGDAAVFGFAIAFFGAVAFLTLSEQARRVDERTE
ncbi:hypothetical protein C464_08570 [Halorubrum coriense DSM 10284]|uniref:Uncharacterized protein n=1 Tax=Halorubrum coriense DSM 10284 TaxID=1227466 RepID=M0EI78_9EURY|nr:hypothetical protein [Halorubrum coriense]ELZ47455.1 hypothetical protein C464_08570 [Halorubrum coriense DSM 10284]